MPEILGNTNLTIRDLAAGLKSDGTVDTRLIEMLAQANPILDDIPMVQANNGTFNKTPLRSGLPQVAWRGPYMGVKQSKSSYKELVNVTGQMSSKLQVDKVFFDAQKDRDGKLKRELKGHMQALGNGAAQALFYGDLKDDARKFNGFGACFAEAGSTGMDDKVPSHYVFDAFKTSGSTDALRSIYLVDWDETNIRGFYPENTPVGVRKSAMRTTDVEDADNPGSTYEAYVQYFYWDLGLDICDFRYAGRIANIELDNVYASGQPDYVSLLDKLEGRVMNSGGSKRVFYMSKLTRQAVRELFASKTRENAFTYEQIAGRKTLTLFGCPIREHDALEVNETKVLAAS